MWLKERSLLLILLEGEFGKLCLLLNLCKSTFIPLPYSTVAMWSEIGSKYIFPFLLLLFLIFLLLLLLIILLLLHIIPLQSDRLQSEHRAGTASSVTRGGAELELWKSA